MTDDAGIPRDFWGRIQKMIEDAVAKLARSGMLRNASITEGGLTIKGGFLRLLANATGNVLFFVGPVTPAFPDGTLQQGWIVRREDGTTALALYDPSPDPASPDGFRQFLALYDRQGNIYASDDTDSGQGMARPYLHSSFYRSDFADWVTVTGTSFVTKFRARMPKQHPRMYVRAWASNDTSGSTGEARILVNGVPWGPVKSTGFAINEYEWGPLPVDGGHMSTLVVEVQARVVSGAGGVRIEPSRLEGRQS